jgi:hypothetical protein
MPLTPFGTGPSPLGGVRGMPPAESFEDLFPTLRLLRELVAHRRHSYSGFCRRRLAFYSNARANSLSAMALSDKSL